MRPTALPEAGLGFRVVLVSSDLDLAEDAEELGIEKGELDELDELDEQALTNVDERINTLRATLAQDEAA